MGGSRNQKRIRGSHHIRECESINLSLKEELSSPRLVEDKDNELVIEEEPLLRTMQVEEQHPWTKIENVLVGVDKFNFPIDSLTLGMEKDRQV